MTLADLGYQDKMEKFRIEEHLESFEIGRVISEHRERYVIWTINGEVESGISGTMRFHAKTREDFPAVGDWVALTRSEFDFAIIHHILPRFSIIKRQAVGQVGQVQVIATNIDYAFLVQAADRDLNINRLERYLTICNSAKVKPLIILTKTDVIDEQQINEILNKIEARIQHVPIIPISNETRKGYETINSIMERRKTYCMLGSSGVGKSTLLNNLAGEPFMRTGAISKSTNKGKHITSHRELIILANGAILIDNPGMREVGIADMAPGLTTTFNSIARLSTHCKFNNCTHTVEKGCAVLDAIEKGEIDKTTYYNYLKMEKENAHYESTLEEKRKKDKDFGKMVKNYKKDSRIKK